MWLILSLLTVWLVLIFPGHPRDFAASSLLRFPVELPVVVLLLAWLNHRVVTRWLCVLIMMLLGTLLLLRLADIGSYLAFNRRFSPLLELHLLADGWNLASTSIGAMEAGLVVVLMLIVLVALSYLLVRCLKKISATTTRSRTVLMSVSLASLLGATLALLAEKYLDYHTPVEARILPEFVQRIDRVHQSIVDQRQFQVELLRDNVLDNTPPGFRRLAGLDVIVLFVESYGRGYVDAERFREAARTRLQSVEQTITESGLAARSGWLTSPIRGGRSWLAHATFQSGLEIDNQARFDRLITTDRASLSSLFSQAGWRSVGLMPAIQFSWPEGSWYGFEDLRDSRQLGYAGERFGYATMPDQYTLSHFEHTVRRADQRPSMTTMALVSTHAPWTPIPQKIDWDSIGDGSVFDGSLRSGEPVSWKYRDKVQGMYAKALDYTLDVIGEFAARYAKDALIIIVGDHQPPPVINGWGKSGDVPIHIIARDPQLLDLLPAEFWTPGMLPDQTVGSQRMSTIRHTLSTVFE